MSELISHSVSLYGMFLKTGENKETYCIIYKYKQLKRYTFCYRFFDNETIEILNTFYLWNNKKTGIIKRKENATKRKEIAITSMHWKNNYLLSDLQLIYIKSVKRYFDNGIIKYSWWINTVWLYKRKRINLRISQILKNYTIQ